MGAAKAADPARRVRSALACQALIHGPAVLDAEADAPAEYAALAASLGAGPTDAQVDAAQSALRAQGAMLVMGLLEGGAAAAAELPGLIDWLEGLRPRAARAAARSSILPRNLGAAFVRKGLGAPLFGLHRPARPPLGRGLLLYYQSAAADGAARLEASWTEGGTALRWVGLGAELGGGGLWLSCVAAPPGAAGALRSAAVRDADLYSFDGLGVGLARRKLRAPGAPRLADPFAYQYAYFFPDGPDLVRRARSFAGDLLGGRYGVPWREAERIAALFIERSL